MIKEFCIGLVACVSASLLSPHASEATTMVQGRPNVLVIMVDDMRKDDLPVMTHTRDLIGAKLGLGSSYRRYYNTTALCCPSRATFLTGQYSSTHGVLDNEPPHGGWNSFQASEANALPVQLQRAGYRTVMAGKYMNLYGTQDNSPTHVPPGWDVWAAQSKGWMNYHNFTTVRGSTGPDNPSTGILQETKDGYITSNVGDRINWQLKEHDYNEAPLFAWASFVAPHTGANGPPDPEPQYRNTSKVGRPFSTAFNELHVEDKPSYIQQRDKLTQQDIAEIINHRQMRRESLKSVDNQIKRFIDTLKEKGQLNNTVIMFMSDNGYMLGEHRIKGGKVVPYEESIESPLLIRNPWFPVGLHSQLVGNIDIAPTIAAIAGTTMPNADGRSILGDWSIDRAIRIEWKGGHVLGSEGVPNIEGMRWRHWAYFKYSTGEFELYNLDTDPWQIRSLDVVPKPIEAKWQELW